MKLNFTWKFTLNSLSSSTSFLGFDWIVVVTGDLGGPGSSGGSVETLGVAWLSGGLVVLVSGLAGVTFCAGSGSLTTSLDTTKCKITT